MSMSMLWTFRTSIHFFTASNSREDENGGGSPPKLFVAPIDDKTRPGVQQTNQQAPFIPIIRDPEVRRKLERNNATFDGTQLNFAVPLKPQSKNDEKGIIQRVADLVASAFTPIAGKSLKNSLLFLLFFTENNQVT